MKLCLNLRERRKKMKVTINIDNKIVDCLAAIFKVKVKGTEEDFKRFDNLVKKVKEEPLTHTADEDLSFAVVAYVLSEELRKKDEQINNKDQ